MLSRLTENVPFIIVTGLDGTGKTTIVRLIENHLKARGTRSKVVWIKSLHTLAYLIATVLRFSGKKNQFVNPNGKVVYRFKPKNYSFSEKVWSIIEFVSIVPIVILKVYLPILAGFTVIADRYLMDTIVMMSTNLDNPIFSNSFIGNTLLRLIPKGTRIIYLDADEATILKRRPDIEYTREEIQTQLVLYRKLATITGGCVINTSRFDLNSSMTEVLEEIQF